MRLVKFFWILSLVGFLAADLFIYGDGPEILNLHLDQNGVPDFAWRKIHFFYYSLTFFLVPNIILMLFGYALPLIPKSILPIPKKQVWLAPDNRKVFYRVAKEWIRGFAFILNLFFIAAIMGFYYVNSNHDFPITWMFYIITAMGAFWLLYGIPLFRKHPDEFA